MQVENIQASYNRQFLCNDGNLLTFEDAGQYFTEVDRIHNEYASKMFGNQIDDKKLYIEPFCIINVDENVTGKISSDSSQKINEFGEKSPEIKQEERRSIEENCGEASNNTDVLNTDSTVELELSDCDDGDISYMFEDEDEDEEEDEQDDDGNTSSDTSHIEIQEKKSKSSRKCPKSKKLSKEKKCGERSGKSSKKYTKKISVTTVNVLDEDNKRLLSYVQMKCDVCSDDRVFDSFAEIQTHFLDSHNQTGYIICCNRKFRRIGRVIIIIFFIYTAL